MSKYGGTCAFECPVDNDSIDIEIQDTSEGIPLEILPKILDPFFTTEDCEKDSAPMVTRKSSGLGFCAVKKLIEEHNGRIGFCSEVGEGSSFLIRLPMGWA